MSKNYLNSFFFLKNNCIELISKQKCLTSSHLQKYLKGAIIIFKKL